MYRLFALLSAPDAASVAPGGERRSAPASRAQAVDEALVQALVQAARAGDQSALSELYALHARPVFRVLRALTRSEADAEELLQDVFVKAFSHLDRYQPRESARFVAWLISIARNSVFNRRRKLGRLVPLDPQRSEDAQAPRTDETSQVDLRAALLQVLAELPERDRWIITLRYGAELTADEVASECGVTPANIRKVTQRQRAYLKARLQSLGFDHEDLA